MRVCYGILKMRSNVLHFGITYWYRSGAHFCMSIILVSDVSCCSPMADSLCA